jgi:putative sigma-54 modulation protein
MDVEYTGRQMTVTKKLKLMVDAALERIEKLTGAAGSVHVILAKDKYRNNAEITIQTRNFKLVAKCESPEMETALHDALAKVERQAVRSKKKYGTIKRHPKKDITAAEPEPPAERIVAVKKAAAPRSSNGRKTVPMLVHSFPSQSPLPEPHIVRSSDGVALRPMSLEEAVKEAAFRDRDVFVFRDHGGQAMVLYRKRDGKMELIEVP